MKNVIGEHLSQLGSYRNLGLIFDIEPFFIKTDKKISIFTELTFDFHSIIVNKEKEGLWISWNKNG